MRAAAEDFQAARVLGVRANTVIATAFGLSGLLAAVAAVLLVVQTGTVTPTVGVNAVLFAFIATVIGGMGSLLGAVLGGFSIGVLTVVLQASLPLALRPYRDAFVFAVVLIVLVARPSGLIKTASVAARDLPRRPRLADLTLRSPRRLRAPAASPAASPAGARLLGGASWHGVWARTVWPVGGLMALTSVVSVLGWAFGSDSLDRIVLGMLINLIVVVGLYTFVGISGVFSFGHVAFMAIGAYAGAIFVIPVEQKAVLLPDLPGFLANAHLAPLPATLAAGGVAALVAAVLAVPLARLSGLTAGLATFAVLLIVNVVAENWQQVTRGTSGISGVPTTTTLAGTLGWVFVAILAAWAFQRSRIGLRLRASREDESAAYSIGVPVGRERGIAFVLSAFFVGVAGALFGMFIGSFNPDAFYLAITFLITAMLIIGSMTSLAGAVVGTIVISAFAELLRRIEMGIDFGAFELSAKPGLREVGLAVVMLLILLLRPAGIMAGRELAWRPSIRPRSRTAASPAPSARPEPPEGGAGLPRVPHE
jgi:branched-chain amino acid transport system permease protein